MHSPATSLLAFSAFSVVWSKIFMRLFQFQQSDMFYLKHISELCRRKCFIPSVHGYAAETHIDFLLSK